MAVNVKGSYAATGTGTAVSNWFMQMATFKAASADTIPPTAPSNLSTLVIGPTQINLSWTGSTDNVGVTGYSVQRCSGSGCTNFAQVASVPGSTTAYNDTSVSPSTTYTYQIIATDAASNPSFLQCFVCTDHRYLNEIRCRPLNRRIHRHALRCCANERQSGFNIPHITTSTKECFGESFLPCVFFCFFKKSRSLRERGEIIIVKYF